MCCIDRLNPHQNQSIKISANKAAYGQIRHPVGGKIRITIHSGNTHLHLSNFYLPPSILKPLVLPASRLGLPLPASSLHGAAASRHPDLAGIVAWTPARSLAPASLAAVARISASTCCLPVRHAACTHGRYPAHPQSYPEYAVRCCPA